MTRYRKHRGGPCPVPPDTRVDVRLRDGLGYSGAVAGNLDWSHLGPDHDDIVAWRPSVPKRFNGWVFGAFAIAAIVAALVGLAWWLP